MCATQEASCSKPYLQSVQTHAGRHFGGRLFSAFSNLTVRGAPCREVPTAETGSAGSREPKLEHAQEKEGGKKKV